MKPLLTGTIVVVFGLGCTASHSPESPAPGSFAEFKAALGYVMTNKEQCDLKGDRRETSVEDIIGVWVDSLLWLNRRPDTCWYGVQSLDRHIRLEVKRSRVFVWKEAYTDTTHDQVDKGEFFLRNDSAGTILVLARNYSSDTLFAQGDTMMSKELQLYWNGKDRLLLVPSMQETRADYEVYDMVRLTPPTAPLKD